MAIAPHSVMLQYTSDFYTKKITTLENYVTRLETHLKTLESLKDQLSSQDFWTGDEAVSYLQQLGTQIRGVRNAHNNLLRSKQLYEESKAEIEKTRKALSLDVSDIAGLVGGLGIE